MKPMTFCSPQDVVAPSPRDEQEMLVVMSTSNLSYTYDCLLEPLQLASRLPQQEENQQNHSSAQEGAAAGA